MLTFTTCFSLSDSFKTKYLPCVAGRHSGQHSVQHEVPHEVDAGAWPLGQGPGVPLWSFQGGESRPGMGKTKIWFRV